MNTITKNGVNINTPVKPNSSQIGPKIIVETVLPIETYTPNTPKAIPRNSLGALLVVAEFAVM